MNPTITADQVASAVGNAASDELREALAKIKHCLSQLSDQQVWWRANESQNSIGNLILHLCGNVRQWAISGLGRQKDVRNRPQEFAERRAIPKAERIRQLDAVIGDARKALSAVSAEQLRRTGRIQGFDVTGLAAIFSTVPHFRGHTQEIIYRTRLLLVQKYCFKWAPTNPEQGAPL